MKRNLVEWAVLAVSAFAIIGLVGVLVVEGLNESRPADPRVVLLTQNARPGSAGWLLPAEVTNDGDEAAEAVLIEASALVDGEPETSELEIDYLPAGTKVEVVFAFSAEPQGEVSVRLVGFRVP
jgi:uncharacterized protein (TIGR02588 family)